MTATCGLFLSDNLIVRGAAMQLGSLRFGLAISLCGFWLFGCGLTVTSSGSGYSCTTQGGKATGQAAGVAFEVDGIAANAGVMNHMQEVVSTVKSAKEEVSEELWILEMGDGKTEFKRTGNGELSLTVAGKKLGALKKGDRVRIDAKRNVLVNGKPREPQ